MERLSRSCQDLTKRSMHHVFPCVLVSLPCVSMFFQDLGKATKIRVTGLTHASSYNSFETFSSRLFVSGTDYITDNLGPTKNCSGRCACGDHFMAATFGRDIFCLNAFFLTGGDNNQFPVCNAPCCTTTCS